MTRTVRDTERCQHRTQERPHVQLNSSRGVDRLSLKEKRLGCNKIVTEFIYVYVNTAQEAGREPRVWGWGCQWEYHSRAVGPPLGPGRDWEMLKLMLWTSSDGGQS